MRYAITYMVENGNWDTVDTIYIDAPDVDTVEINMRYILEDFCDLEPVEADDIIENKRFYITCPDDVGGVIMESGLRLA